MVYDDRTQLIPRDQPIDAGRELIFEFKISVTVKIDDLTGDTEPISLAELEAISGSVDNPEAVFRMVANMNERQILDHFVRFADVGRDEGRDERPRFELEWERRERVAGKTGAWERSRVWLDAIPSPRAGASA